MELSIIIVNWKSADYLHKCLKSIFQTVKDIEFETLVIDNASYDGSADIVRSNYPSVKYIQSKKNLGFASANNLAYKFSKGKFILFLNPDTELLEIAAKNLVRAMESLPKAGAVGATLINTDFSLQTSCIQPFPTPLNQAIDLEFLKERFPTWRLWGMRELFSCDGSPSIVEAVSGACLMVKRDVFDLVGMFSTDYFMYSEDIDLCYKIRAAGYKVYYIPIARVIHHGGKSSSRHPTSYFHEVLMRESVARFIRKSQGPAAERRYRIMLAMSAIARLAVLSTVLFLKFHSDTKRKLCKLLSRKWLKILFWAVGSTSEVQTADMA